MATVGTGQVTLVDLTDAYGVILTSEAHVFPGTESAAKAGSATTQILAMRGKDSIDASVTLSEVTAPTGVTVTKDASTSSPTLTITVDTSFTTAGGVVIPVHIGSGDSAVTITKHFSVSIAFTGAAGQTYFTYVRYGTSSAGAGMVDTPTAATNYIGICISTAKTAPTTATSYTWSKYAGADGTNGTSATNAVIGNESVSIPCTKDGLVSSATTITIPFAGYIGSARCAATIAYSTLPSGITLATNTPATTSANGSLVLNVAASGTLGGASVLTGNITLTVTANGIAFARMFTWAKSLTGATGADGEDAITIVITSSNGLIFKNTAGSTTLTAHVYKGGLELSNTTTPTLASMGTISWYKDGSTTATATGQTLAVDAGVVTNTATYVVKLDDGS